MKRSILLAVALLFTVSFAFSQAKNEEKPLRKIASGNGARQIEEDVREAMKEVRVELDNMNIEIDQEIREAMEEVRRELKDLEFDLNEEIDIDIDNDLDLDLDINHDFDIDINIDIDQIVRTAVNNASRAINDEEIARIVETAVKESTRAVKVRVKP